MSGPPPADNNTRLRLISALEDLITAFEQHPKVAQQPGNINYMWDFVNRTKHNLEQCNPNELEGRDKPRFQDAIGRCTFQDILIHDTTGKLSLMTGEDPSNPVDFGDAIRQKSRAVHDAIGNVQIDTGAMRAFP